MEALIQQLVMSYVIGKNQPNTGSYKLTQGESTQFVIPTSSVDTVGTMWGGGIMARLKLNDSWVIGQCNAGQESLGGALCRWCWL